MVCPRVWAEHAVLLPSMSAQLPKRDMTRRSHEGLPRDPVTEELDQGECRASVCHDIGTRRFGVGPRSKDMTARKKRVDRVAPDEASTSPEGSAWCSRIFRTHSTSFLISEKEDR